MCTPQQAAIRLAGAALAPQAGPRRHRIETDCGIPLISQKVRVWFKRAYPAALSWGRTNETQHAAFQCMWMQFDHVLPHSRGGDNSFENVVVTCAPCNNARWHWTLDEVGLIDPRKLPTQKTPWDGLERLLAVP
jgi:5-methylcytosine-specific restriction endonuclease McrA